MVWFKPGQGNFYNNLMSANNPGQLHFLLAALLNGNVVIMAGHSAAVVTTDVAATVAVPPNGSWMNIALVYDAGATTMTIYVNGKIAATQGGIAAAPAITGTAPVTIGSFSSVAGQFGVDGSIAGVRAWNSTLSSAQISSIYNYELLNRAGF